MLKKILRFSPGVVIPMGMNFFLTILYARFLSTGEYGKLNIYLNTIQILYSVTVSVFQTAELRFYSLESSYDNDKTKFVSTYLMANVIVTLIMLPCSYVVNVVFPYEWCLVALSVGCNGLYQFFCNLYRLEGKAHKYNSLRTVQSICAVVALVGASFIFNPMNYTCPIIVVYGAYGVLAFIELFKRRKDINIRLFSGYLLRKSLQYGIPLIGVSVLGYIVSSSDQYFLLYFLGEEAVGNYALGYRLVDALIVNMLMMILLVMTPELARNHDQEGEEVSCITLKQMLSAAIWIILPISFAIIVYTNEIIRFVFPEYVDAAHIMRLVVFAAIFHGISMFTCKGLELVKRPSFIFYSLLLAAIINCVYNAIFIPIYGIDASAHSSLVAYLIYNLLLVFFTWKKYPLKFDWSYIFKTSVATLVVIFIAIVEMKIMPIHSLLILIIEGCICLVVYLLISWKAKLLNVFK